MKKLKAISVLILVIALCMSTMTVTALADDPAPSPSPSVSPSASFNKVVTPVVDLINALLKPMLTIVVAIGSLYCVILGVKYAKAEEPQDREKAKQHLKNAIVGFVIIFILILALNVLKQPLIDWVNAYAGSTVIK